MKTGGREVKALEMHELFRVALGLDKPWQVDRVEFDAEQGHLELWLNFPRGSRFACPQCEKPGGAVHDTVERTWRHLNFFEHRSDLHARVPRVKCPDCGVKTVEVPWARPGSGFTLLMEAFLLLLVQGGMTPAQVGRMVGEHDTRVWRVLRRYVEKARAEADFSQVRTVGLDETSRARGHQYISVFMDLAAGRRRVLFACEGRDGEAVGRFVEDLQAHGGSAEQVQRVCLDMSPAYLYGLQEHLPDARITFDQFHLIKLANDAVDRVRREEQRDRPELKKTRWLWLKNEWNFTADQAQTWAQLKGAHLRTARAWSYKSQLQDIFLPQNRPQAEELLQSWCAAAQRSRLRPLILLARTIRNHWTGILNWFDSRISNGILEAINGLIQAAKRRARGYRNPDYLITMVYLIAGKLAFNLPAYSPSFTHSE